MRAVGRTGAGLHTHTVHIIIFHVCCAWKRIIVVTAIIIPYYVRISVRFVRILLLPLTVVRTHLFSLVPRALGCFFSSFETRFVRSMFVSLNIRVIYFRSVWKNFPRCARTNTATYLHRRYVFDSGFCSIVAGNLAPYALRTEGNWVFSIYN